MTTNHHNEQSEVKLEPCPKCLDALALTKWKDAEVSCGRCGFNAPFDTWQARASVAAPQGDAQQALCLLCSHNGVAPDGTCMVPVPICSDDDHGTRRCGCKCRFAAATSTPVDGEQGWLLEKMHNGNVHYISADYVLQWTDDPGKALRLARREDAEALCTIVEDCEKIASHEWVAAATTPPAVTTSQVQCADCLAWIDRDANHTCRQQVRRNQRNYAK